MLSELSSQLAATSIWEWCAAAFAVAYGVLAIRESVWCWPAAFFSTAIYAFLFFDVHLYMEFLLNLYYLVMAIYGWYQWQYCKKDSEVKPIVRWPIKTHLLCISICVVGVITSAFILEKYTDQTFAYIDSFTTWFAVFTTYMLAKKVLENWIYWIVIDSVSIYLYFQKGFLVTVLLFIGYTLMAIIGWIAWKKHFDKQQVT